MTPEQLKASILQYAIQGKLVEQRQEDGTGEELYQQIVTSREILIKENVIKRDKRTETSVNLNEVPFEIPEYWKWVTLGSILNKLTDGTHKTPKYTADGVKFVSVKDMSNGFLSLENTKFISEEEHQELYARCNPEKGDIILSKVGTTGVPAIVDTDEIFSLFVSVALLKFDHNCVDKKFLYYMLMSPLVQAQATENTRGVGNKNWVLDAIANTMVVLPPLAEQKRIVAKIEELLPIVNRYAVAYDKLEKFNAKFPKDMKKSILQYAIQGKLVEQRAGEGTGEELHQQIQDEKKKLIIEGKIKKEKTLTEITDDEIPFDIPDSWKWVRLGQCGTFVRGSGIKKDEVTTTGLPCVRYGQLYTHYKTKFSSAVSFIPEELFQKCQKIHQSDILMALTGENNFDIALAVTYEGEAPVAMGGDMTKFTGYFIDPLYFTYVINSPYGIMCKSKLATGNIIVHISNDKLASIPIPLPPLAEQKRIVAKIEELLPYCDRLVKEMEK